MSALDSKIVPFPTAELPPKDSHLQKTLAIPPEKPASGLFRGGGLRGLFWALLLEGGLVVLAAGAIVTWHILRR